MLYFKIPSKERIVVYLLTTLVIPIFLSSCKKNTDTQPDKTPLAGKYHYVEQYFDRGVEELYELYLTITQSRKDKIELEFRERFSYDGKSEEESFKFENVGITSPTSFFTQQTVTFEYEDGYRKRLVYKIQGELRGNALYLTADDWNEGHPEESSPDEYVMTRIE